MFKKIYTNIRDNSKTRKRYVFWITFFVILSFIMFSDHGIIKRYNLESQKKEYAKKIELEYKNKDSLNRIIKKLRSDTLEIERIAREKYGMVKPGEEVYIIRKKKAE